MFRKFFHKYKSSFIFILVVFSLFFINKYDFSLFKSHYKNNNPNEMYVHYIDVGQGDSILIQVNNKNLLIDSGPRSDKDKLISYLSSLKLSKLDYVIATHPHEDHIGNMSTIIKNYKVLSFYAPKIQNTSKTFERMVEALKDNNLKINILRKGSNSINLGDNTRVTVFSPIDNYYENLNNYSPIIKVEYGNNSFLFTGDAEKEVEEKIIANNDDINADVIKIGHHGSSTSTSKAFIDKVNPSIAVISVGENNSYNHPNEDVINRLNGNKIKIYRTDKDGTIIFSSNGLKITKR